MTGQSLTIYIAGPLFSAAERRFNIEIAEALRADGHEVLLPQDSCPPFVDILAETATPEDALSVVFEKDMEMLDRCNLLVFVLDGRVPDEGACFELGYAYAKGMRLVGIKTDSRSSIEGLDNAMIAVPLHGAVAKDVAELARIVRSL